MPEELSRLLDAQDERAREAAWASFLERFSGLILYVARSRNRDHDAVMNCYAFVVDRLQRNACARLRSFTSNGRGEFSTWLIVVVRRLCVDYHRHRYGRPQGADGMELRDARRQLTDLVADELALAMLPAPAEDAPDATLLRAESSALLSNALESLTPSDRLVLRFRFEDNLSVPQIARLLGIASPFVVYRQLDNVLARLRRALQRAGVENAT